MKNKVAVFTLQDIANYGNRYQNFAVCYLLSKRGYNPVNILFSMHPFLKKIFFFPLLKRSTKQYSGYEKTEYKREKIFFEFNKAYLNFKYFKPSSLSRIKKCYDYFVVGSDQVWNPRFNKNGENYLNFVDNPICISPSFGINALTYDEEQLLKTAITKYKVLSVREESGKKILEKITDKKVVRLCDPTLAVKKEVWEKIERKPTFDIPEKYILSYTLGEKGSNNIGEQLKIQLSIPIIDIFDNTKKNTYIVGPAEFLWLIHHAEIVVTDSFHATVFSIIFHTKFVVFKRLDGHRDMSSRLSELLDRCHFHGKFIESEKIKNININDYDFQYSDEHIQNEQKVFTHYLDEVLPELNNME